MTTDNRAEPLTEALVDDLRAEFDQGHFIDWEAVVPYILLRTATVVHVGDPDDRARSYNDGFDEALRQYGIDPSQPFPEPPSLVEAALDNSMLRAVIAAGHLLLNAKGRGGYGYADAKGKERLDDALNTWNDYWKAQR